MQHVTEIHYRNDTQMHVGRQSLSLQSAEWCTDDSYAKVNTQREGVQSQQQRKILSINFCALHSSIPKDVSGNFHWHNPSCHTMALGSTQPLTEMSTRNISWGVKGAGA